MSFRKEIHHARYVFSYRRGPFGFRTPKCNRSIADARHCAVNHVGMNVPNLAEAAAFYTEVMGFPEAFRLNNDAGELNMVYVQVSENTFVNCAPPMMNGPQALPMLNACEQSGKFACDLDGARRRYYPGASERRGHFCDNFQCRRSLWQPHGAARVAAGIASPSGNGTLAVEAAPDRFGCGE